MKRSLGILAGMSIATVATQAHAQDQAGGATASPNSQTDASSPVGLADIVVTAQRRSESAQDVPISITAANSLALAEAHVDNISNIQAISPSVNVRNSNFSASAAKVIIRGLGTTGNSRAFEGSVGVFIDGVYRTRAGAALLNFLDIDNLQVLRGPQGTLFGKNTTAGALLLTSAKPDPSHPEYLVDLSYGNYDSLVARAAVGVPLSDTVAVRIAGLVSQTDGFFADATTGARLNGDKTQAVKGQILFKPSDSVSMRLIGDYSHGSGNCCYATSVFIAGPTKPLIDTLTVAAGGKVPSPKLGDYQQTLNVGGGQVVEDYGATLLSEFDIGAGTLKSVTGWRTFKVGQNNMDADFSGADIYRLTESFRSRFLSQELTYVTKVDALNADLLLGAFVSDEKIDATRDQEWGSQAQTWWDTTLAARRIPPGTVYAAPGFFAGEIMGGKSQSYSVFAHLDAKVASNFNVIVGMRYSIEHKEGFFRNSFYRPQPNEVFRVLGLRPGPEFNVGTTDRALSGTFGLQYRPARDVMLYATYNRGFKAGGVNIDVNGAGARANNPAEVPGAIPKSPIYRPEQINAFEVGAKAEYFDRRARTNISLFYYDISDIQISQFVGLTATILNSKSAKDYGMEIENLFQLSKAFTLGLDGIWIPRANFGNDPSIDPVLSGSRFRYAPKIQANATLAMDQPISDTINLLGRVQYQYSSGQLLNNASLTKRGGLSLLNANLGVRFPHLGLTAEVWAMNITNRAYPTLTINTPFQTGTQNAYLGAPRTYGFRLRASF